MAKINRLGILRKAVRQINMLEILDKCISETSSILIDLVRNQLSIGESGTGQMPEYKSDKYALKKQEEGSKAPFGITDLKKEGNFYNKFKLRMLKNNILIRSTDKKAQAILKKYGPDIYQLNEKNLNFYVNNIIEPLMLKKINNGLLK